MTPEEWANDVYTRMWIDNGTHDEKEIIAYIAAVIREAEHAARLDAAYYAIKDWSSLIGESEEQIRQRAADIVERMEKGEK